MKKGFKDDLLKKVKKVEKENNLDILLKYLITPAKKMIHKILMAK